MQPIIIFIIFFLIVILAWYIQAYNRSVNKFNTLVESFPAFLIAKKFKFEKQPYFSLDLATQRELPEINFSNSSG